MTYRSEVLARDDARVWLERQMQCYLLSRGDSGRDGDVRDPVRISRTTGAKMMVQDELADLDQRCE